MIAEDDLKGQMGADVRQDFLVGDKREKQFLISNGNHSNLTAKYDQKNPIRQRQILLKSATRTC